MNFETMNDYQIHIAEIVKPYQKFIEKLNNSNQLRNATIKKLEEKFLDLQSENIELKKHMPVVDYRKDKEMFDDFVSVAIKPNDNDTKLKISIVKEEFKNWYQSNYGNAKNPPYKQLLDYMGKKYGRTTDGWSNIKIEYN